MDGTYRTGMVSPKLFVIEPSTDLYVDLEEQHYKVCNYPVHGVDIGFLNCYFRGRLNTIDQKYNMQHHCNTNPWDKRCYNFLARWWHQPRKRASLCMLHDTFFKYSPRSADANDWWWRAYNEMQKNVFGKSRRQAPWYKLW
ncbi:hypothetical protein CYMTET_28631 [Cymbomonas tetramitiformis]|uniref:Uncharacterized protein n=1 Tax=Cymbomonas tetramitiformis TaxID=36881 RepID=A0AAE0FMK1_9CHLO|nr:hypothetical protein CYMTET_28631 [Cymbomonas tetramitiformis]